MNENIRDKSIIPVYIFTDGACSGNPGPGGWGAILKYRDSVRELCGWAGRTTNNRMELLAAIRALEALTRPCTVIITTDSNYLKQGITSWIKNWKKNGWKTAGRKPVKNQDLWRTLDDLCKRHDISWKWVKGHAGHPENEKADALARAAIAEGQQGMLEEDPAGAVRE